MSRSISAAVLFGLLAAATPGQAGWNEFWGEFENSRVTVNQWPMPYTPLDVQAARAPFGTMIAKGWQRQNMLGDYHFNKDSTQLTQAGQLRVRWILSQAPAEHRTVFVERGPTAEQTASRVDVVQQAAVQMVPHGQLPQVAVSEMATRGWPAEYVDSINRKYQESVPAPRLQQASSGATSAGN